MTAPCKDCEARAVSCHSDCEGYQEYLRWKADDRKALIAYKAQFMDDSCQTFGGWRRKQVARRREVDKQKRGRK